MLTNFPQVIKQNGHFQSFFDKSEYMLNVANGPILAEKKPKNPFLAILSKSGKTPPKKNFLFQPSHVGFSRI
jgi:hypothetical protein